MEERLKLIEQLVTEIKSFPSFAPSQEVNEAFSELVRLVVGEHQNPSQFYVSHNGSVGLKVLQPTHPTALGAGTSGLAMEDAGRFLFKSLRGNIPVSFFCSKHGEQIRELASLAEYEMEMFWAKKIAESPNPHAIALEFPYLENYQELVKRELQLVENSGLSVSGIDSVLIVGSGPLPLTALEIARRTGAKVDQVDCSAGAIEICEKVSLSLGLDGERILADGKDVVLERGYKMVMIAGLAGSSVEEKQEILENVLPHLSNGGRLVLRGAYGLRELLYPGFEPQELTGVNLMKQYHPGDQVINSVFIYEPATRAVSPDAGLCRKAPLAHTI